MPPKSAAKLSANFNQRFHLRSAKWGDPNILIGTSVLFPFAKHSFNMQNFQNQRQHRDGKHYIKTSDQVNHPGTLNAEFPLMPNTSAYMCVLFLLKLPRNQPCLSFAENLWFFKTPNPTAIARPYAHPKMTFFLPETSANFALPPNGDDLKWISTFCEIRFQISVCL